MASKTTKKARRAAGIKSNIPVPKDDGTRWAIVRNSQRVYLADGGVIKGEAERLASGLLEPAEIVQIS